MSTQRSLGTEGFDVVFTGFEIDMSKSSEEVRFDELSRVLDEFESSSVDEDECSTEPE